jgi:GNAT superfamily N-acetyltransferase
MMRRLRSRLRTLAALARRHGILAASHAVASLVRGRRVLQLVGVEDRDFVGPGAEPASAPCHQATLQEIEALVAEGHQEPEAFAIFALGDPCLVQTLDGRFAGLAWLSLRPVVELLPGVSLEVPPDAVYSYRSWTHPAFRGRGLQSLRHRAILDFARPHGRHRLLAFVRSTNFESLKGVRKSGCKPVGSVEVKTRGEHVSFEVTITDPAWSAVRAARPEPARSDEGP